MIQHRTLQHIAALAIIGAGITIAWLMGAQPVFLVILLAVGVVLLFLLWGNITVPTASPAPTLSPLIPPVDLLGMAEFRQITDGMTGPVLVVDQGKVVLANGDALTLLGSHILGEDVRVAIRHPAAAERLAGQESLSAPTRIDIVGLGARNQRWAMNIIPLETPSPLHNGQPHQQRLFVHLTDESGLHTVERMRGDFVANASHELRTPLAGILGFVETLQDPDAGGDAQTRARFLSIIEKEARRMQQLVDDLMSLSRIEADKYRLPSTQVELPALMEEVLSTCRLSLGERGQDIIAAISDDVGSIHGDKMQISQLLHNLVSNSAKYGRTGTPITVRLTPAPPSMIRLEVCDEGEGISQDHLPRLTERFYRVDSGRSRAIGGTGLGLAIVKHIVERHRGRLDIASTPGKGTNVSVLLPVANMEATDK